MSFNALSLDADVLESVEDLGYTEPTPIQEQAIPLVLDGRDVLACAQTGTGKTAAFILPALSAIEPSGTPRMLVVTPTRELCVQIEEVARIVGKRTGHKVVAVYGGVGYKDQIRKLDKGVDIIVATPGRLLDLHQKKHVDLSGIEMLVLDEADRMLDMGFWPDVRKIIRLLPRKRQNMLFSATLSDAVLRVIGDALDDPARVDVAPASLPVDQVTQYVYAVNASQKTELLVALLNELDEYRAIVFTRTKMRADRLESALASSGIKSETVHSDRTQKHRSRVLKQFREGQHSLLIATDVMARGIDVEGITHVINYDVPDRAEDYVHRIGRTARAGETGVAITLLAYEEMDQLREIERTTTCVLENKDVAGFDYKDRIIPNKDRSATAARTVFRGGVGRRGAARGRGRRF
jgi:ATP-dependent RNA helicase RhlE